MLHKTGYVVAPVLDGLVRGPKPTKKTTYIYPNRFSNENENFLEKKRKIWKGEKTKNVHAETTNGNLKMHDAKAYYYAEAESFQMY